MSGYDDAVIRQYSRDAGRYDRRWSFYVRATTQATLKRMTLERGARILDVGCGTGAMLQALADREPGVELTGLDPTAEMLAVAGGKLPGSIELKLGRAEDIPFDDETFDTVVSCNMFHYLRRPDTGTFG